MSIQIGDKVVFIPIKKYRNSEIHVTEVERIFRNKYWLKGHATAFWTQDNTQVGGQAKCIPVSQLTEEQKDELGIQLPEDIIWHENDGDKPKLCPIDPLKYQYLNYARLRK